MTVLRVVKGNPDDDELAAAILALSIVSARREAGRRATSRPSARWAWRTALGGGGGATWRTLGGFHR
jgi:acyl-CoA carboxylase epsilon subunit-like protein